MRLDDLTTNDLKNLTMGLVRRGYDYHMAEDAVQQALVELVEEGREITPMYLDMRVISRAQNMNRQPIETVSLDQLLEEGVQIVAKTTQNELAKDIADAVEGLDKQAQEFIRLKIQGYSNADAAVEMGLSTMTVKRLWNRIKPLLATRLKDYEHGNVGDTDAEEEAVYETLSSDGRPANSYGCGGGRRVTPMIDEDN